MFCFFCFFRASCIRSPPREVSVLPVLAEPESPKATGSIADILRNHSNHSVGGEIVGCSFGGLDIRTANLVGAFCRKTIWGLRADTVPISDPV